MASMPYNNRNNQNQPGMVGQAYNPSFSRGKGRRMKSSKPAQARLVRPYLENKIKGCGSSGRVPASHGQGPEFKPYYHQKKREKNRTRIY
jgi:hypothetical protein